MSITKRYQQSDTGLTLDRLAVGHSGRIDRVEVNGDGGLHLLEMGLTPGTTVAISRMAPFGDPIEVSLRGYRLSLRRAEAQHVVMQGTSQEGD